MKCVKVLKKDAEKIKKALLKANAYAFGYPTLSDKTFVYFPVLKAVKGFTLVEKRAALKKKEDAHVGAFDHIGDIIIVGEDVPKAEARKLLKRSNVNVVLQRKGIHHGEYRTQDLEWIAGEKRKVTAYKENGVSLKLHVEKCYFSPRLSTERMRIAHLVKPKEKILVLFSGVGPYPLVLAKHTKAQLIIGVEKNPLAHKYALENCRKYLHIVLYNMDAKQFTYPERFDRVIMPLPHSAEEFLDVAVTHLRKGGIVHFYTFAQDAEIPDKPVSLIREKIGKVKVLRVVKCGQYAPGKFRVCVDFTL